MNKSLLLQGDEIMITLEYKGLGSLQQIADELWRQMKIEVERNGHSDLTFCLEASHYGIRDIIELNNLSEINLFKEEEE